MHMKFGNGKILSTVFAMLKIHILSAPLTYVENLEACNQETNGSRPLSSLSGGSKSQDSSEEKESKSGSSSGSGNDSDIYHSSEPPSPFPSDGEEEEEEKVIHKTFKDEKETNQTGSSSEDNLSDDDERPFDYASVNPQRTSTIKGVFSTNCKKRLKTEQYKSILNQASRDPDICYKEYPKMFPEPGTILCFNVEQVQLKWDLKDLSMAQSEVRADGWSWLKSTGASTRHAARGEKFKVVVDHFRGRNKHDGELEEDLPFDLWQYTSGDDKWQLLHYLGHTENIAAGYPHGNSVQNIPISRSTRSAIQRLIRKSVDQKPTDVIADYWKELEEEVARDPQLALVKGPKNQKQVSNARQRALNEARLSSNTIDNISKMGLRLRYPGYFLNQKPTTPRSFIDVLGLTDTNLFVYFENPMLFEEMGKVMNESGIIMKLYYDTKFDLGDFFLSVLSWEHPYYRTHVLLAGYIHDDKSHNRHEDFFRRIWQNNVQYLQGGEFVLITDGEFRLSNIWPNLKNLYCFLHMKENMKRALRGKGKAYRELCVQLFTELQQKETPKSFDKKLKRCLAAIDSKKAAKIFKFYGLKLKERCSRWIIRKCKLPDEVVMTQPAESMNALIGRYQHKPKLFPDELLVIVFFVSQDQYGKIQKGYYRVPQGFTLTNEHLDKIRGEAREVPSLAYVPALTEIMPYIKNKSSLPLMPGMQRTGPLILKKGGSNPNTLNAMAQDLVLKKRVTQNPESDKLFQVLDLGDNYHAIQLKDRDLSKQNYRCSCSEKDCVHLRAVFLFLNYPPDEIPCIANKNPLQLLKRQRNKNKNETEAGGKKARRGESTKNYQSEDENDDNEQVDKDDDMNKPSIKKEEDDDEKVEVHDEEGEDSFDEKKGSSASHSATTGKFALSSPTTSKRRVVEKGVLTGLKDKMDGTEVKQLKRNVTKEEKELRKELRTRYEAFKNVYTPPEVTFDVPPWWNDIADELMDTLHFKEVFKPNFQNLLPVIPEQKAIIFVTADDHYAICYRSSADKLTLYSLDDTLPENTPEEMVFTASHCARNDENQEVSVTIFNNKDEGDRHPLLMAALKIMLLSGEFKPEFYKFNLNEITETSYAALLEVYNEKQPSNSQTFLLNKKQRFWCCCKRSHFVATERRNAFLKVPDMVQCSGCQNHFFKTCVNYSLDRQSKKKWFCYNCSASKLPLLPSWGHGGSNTCTMDNVITGCVLEYKRDKKFIQLIGDTPFEEALKTFLLHMGTTVGSIAAAKQQFITKVYHNRNLYGTEDEIIFDRLITVCGVCNNFECPNCGEKTRSGFRRKNYIGQNTIGNSVAETIDNVFNLRSIEIPNMRCDNEINGQRCNANLTVSEIKYAQQYPWILPIGLANEAVNRIFGFKELEDLPAKVEYNGRQYIIGGITFNRNDHFVSILPVDGGWVYFDGLETDHPVASISDALKHVVKRNSVISTIFYFLTQSPKSKN